MLQPIELIRSYYLYWLEHILTELRRKAYEKGLDIDGSRETLIVALKEACNNEDMNESEEESEAESEEDAEEGAEE